jgi:hypothetical protein
VVSQYSLSHCTFTRVISRGIDLHRLHPSHREFCCLLQRFSLLKAPD